MASAKLTQLVAAVAVVAADLFYLVKDGTESLKATALQVYTFIVGKIATDGLAITNLTEATTLGSGSLSTLGGVSVGKKIICQTTITAERFTGLNSYLTIGPTVYTPGADSVSINPIGPGGAKGDRSIAMGWYTLTTVAAHNAVCVGPSCEAAGPYDIVIGYAGSTDFNSQRSIVIGSNARSTANYGIAIGSSGSNFSGALVTTLGGIAIGGHTVADSQGARGSAICAVAIGGGTTNVSAASASANHAVALGSGSVANEVGMVALGGTNTSKVKIGGKASILTGTGSPESAVVGSVGDLFLRTDGGAGTTLYVKESGSATNTGWIAK